jgi:DNA polymerase-3 subunit delta'
MREYFSELYGNTSIKGRLGNAIDSETLPHAFLVIGSSGAGKRTLALEFAAALNCERRSDKSSPLPCHSCNTCRRIKDGNFTDITRLCRQSGKATIGVEEVRLFREDMFLSPTESAYKVYVIEEAEKLTPNAQNALLTVLEEPPRNVFILLLAESGDKILTTIKSRTQSIAMEKFEAERLREYLVAKNDRARLYSRTDENALDGIIMSSDGRIGMALTLLSDKEAKENAEDRLLVERIIKALHPASQYSELHSALSELPTSRIEFTSAVENLMSAIRDISLIKFDRDVPLLFYTNKEKAQIASRDMNTKRLMSIYELLKSAVEDTSKNVGIPTVIATLGAKIKLI